MENALSIDLEDWYHPLLVRRNLGQTPKSPRVVEAAAPLLELLRRYGVRATFFCVGEVLERHPDLVRRIHGLGHEIGCHGMRHRLLRELTPGEFGAELDEFERLARRVLGEGARIRGFRAPTFSLDHGTRWALPLLARRGYLYDSSVFPMRGPLYGVPGAPVAPYRIDLDDPAAVDPRSSLMEFPPAVCRIAGMSIPVGGGVYLRLLPLRVLARLLARINRERPFVIYTHPWESDPATPRVPMQPMARFATYHGIRHTLGKLEQLLRRFRFTTVAEVVERWSVRRGPAAREATC